MRQLFRTESNKQYKTAIPESQYNSQGKPHYCPHFLPGDNFPITAQRAGAQAEHGMPAELKRQRTELRVCEMDWTLQGEALDRRELCRRAIDVYMEGVS